jgi:hypothetical protein
MLPRYSFTGKNYYIYHAIKLDKEKYPEGAELLIFCDPYKEGRAVPVSVNFYPQKYGHEKVLITEEMRKEGGV